MKYKSFLILKLLIEKVKVNKSYTFARLFKYKVFDHIFLFELNRLKYQIYLCSVKKSIMHYIVRKVNFRFDKNGVCCLCKTDRKLQITLRRLDCNY